nr:uncharacterized protein LOC109163082 [Ipomoea batatas]
MRGAQRLSHSNGCRWGPDEEQAAGTNGSMRRSRVSVCYRISVVVFQILAGFWRFLCFSRVAKTRTDKGQCGKALDEGLGRLRREEVQRAFSIRKKSRSSLGLMTVEDVNRKKAKVVRCELDGSDDDFVAPPLASLARLQEDPVWKALDGGLTAEEDAAFPKIKTRSHAFGKKSKVSQSQPGVSHSCESNDDFVLPPLTFLARLQKYPVWNAPDHELTTEEDAKFPRVKTRAPSAVFVKFI